uniref:BAG domain-containing protein n=1 Tax=Strigamia maritima TaxID=126957 RepID=T1J9B3_STRMM
MAATGDRANSPRIPNANSQPMVHHDGLFNRSDSMAVVSKRLVEMLDHVEHRVELLREHAAAMEQERDCLLTMIKTIQENKELDTISAGFEKEEIQITAERLLARCLAVEIQVSTPRNQMQSDALFRINQFIDDLVAAVRTDWELSERKCQMFLNSCLADCKGALDQKFQACLIECTADDQKKIKKRLDSLLKTIQHMSENRES